MSSLPRPSRIDRWCAEPFRVFFPLGLLIGISGVSLWPLFLMGMHKVYPGVMHARMMTQGFVSAFVIGFLATALPRLTETRAVARLELAIALLLFLASTGLQIAHQSRLGDAFYLALLLLFLARLLPACVRQRTYIPPSFILVGVGILNAVAGTALLLGGADGASPRTSLVGMLLLYVGFPVAVILGAAAFFLPRILASDAKETDGSSSGAATRLTRTLAATGTGIALSGSVVWEVLGEAPRIAPLVRLCSAMVYLAVEARALPISSGTTTLGRCFRLAVLLLLAGVFFPALWPWQRVAGEHVLFIGGVSLITLTVATRVMLGHRDEEHRFSHALPVLIGAACLLVLGTVLRVAADFYLAARTEFLSHASCLWMAAAAIWGVWIWRRPVRSGTAAAK